MTIFMRCIILLTLVATIVPPGTAMAQNGVHIVVNFIEVRAKISGGGRAVARTVEAVLLGGNRIVDVDRRQGFGGGRGPRRGHRGRGGNNQRSDSIFRGSFRPVQNGRATGNWRVGPNNTLVRTVSYASDEETIVVSLSGAHSCVASVTFRLKPGHRVFVRRLGTIRFRDVHAQGISCSISG